MTSDRWQRIEALFAAAEALPTEERSAWLAEQCDDDELRHEVEALLACATVDATSDILREVVNSATERYTALSGERVGPFVMRKRLGSGGMGDVYLAEQAEPVKRRVALKVIRRGMDTDRILARFELERQMVAVMDHPGIARIFEAGATPDGRPYFAMELVDGESIVRYSDHHRLDLDARLALFRQVCDAVQHAHQKGIVHRDLKPSNILVKEQDGQPVVKIIDFGIAKATHEKLGTETFYTDAGVLVGTPEYMSPEQAISGGTDLDTRSDIYSLGLVLHELLTGELPFDRHALRGSSFAEVQRTICDEEAPKPSSRTGCRHLRGDLDWIVLKALEKDRDRRYDSAAALAEDLHRYASNEPVLATSPTTFYRFGKFAKRNRGLLSSLTVIALALTIGLVVALVQLSEARQARDDSVATIAFLTDMLLRIEPDRLGDREVTVRQVLDEAEQEVDQFEDRPRIEARLRYTVGKVYLALGDWTKAEGHLPRALELYRQFYGATHPDTVNAMHALGALYGSLGRYDEGEPLLEESVRLLREQHGDADDRVLSARGVLADHWRDRGGNERAREVLAELVAICEEHRGANHPQTATFLGQLGVVEKVLGNGEQATRLLRRALEIQTAELGWLHRTTLSTAHSLAVSLVDDRTEAHELYQRTREGQLEVLGPDHPDTLLTEFDLAVQKRRLRDFDGALAGLDAVIPRLERVKGANQRTTLAARTSRAGVYGNMGRSEDALAELEAVHSLQRKHLGPDHRDTIATETFLMQNNYRLGRYADALPFIEHVVAVRTKELGLTHRLTLTSRVDLGAVLLGMGEAEKSIPVFEGVIAGYSATVGEFHDETMNAMAHWVNAHKKLQRHQEVATQLERWIARARATLGDGDRGTLELEHRLAHAYGALDRDDGARTLFAKTRDKSIAWGVRDGKFREYHRCFARFLADRDELTEAAEIHRGMVEAMRVDKAPPMPLSSALIDCVRVVRRQGDAAASEVEALLREALPLRRVARPNEVLELARLEGWLGESLVIQAKYAEAERVLLAVAAIIVKSDVSSEERAASRERLVRLYEGWGKPELAEEWRSAGSAGDEPGQ